MFKRIISSLIIFSMLWIDVAAAMNEDDSPLPSKTLSLIRSTSKSPPRSDRPSTEKSTLLREGEKKDTYDSLTRMEQFPPSSQRSINDVNKSDSSSDEEHKGSEHDLRPRLEESESKKKTGCCWPPFPSTCCRKKTSLLLEEDKEDLRESESLFVEVNAPSLSDIRKKALLTLQIPPDEESPSDVILLDEQPMEEEELLLQKGRALAKEFKGTSLEDFGRWYQGHVINGGWRLLDFGGLLVAGGMSAGTGGAMSPIVIWSLNNKYAKWLNDKEPYALPFMYYINTTTALIAFTDAVLFMADATAPSTRTFTIPKNAREKRADRVLVSLALLPGIYLLLLGFQIQQEHKKATGTTGWWNEYDQYFYFTSLGFFPYLFAQTFIGIRAAVSRMFHPTVPEHVREDVLALRQLEARIDAHLSDPEIHELYTFFTGPLFAQNASKLKKWAAYCFKGEMADIAKVEGVLTYLCLRKYAKESLQEAEEEPQPSCAKKGLASRIMSGLGTPAGFGVIAISLFGLFESFMGPIPALALSLTGATLGFLPGALVQSHNLGEALDTIREGIIPYLKGKGGVFKETLKDPYAWGRGAGKVWAVFQNTLTNLAPILVSLAILIPEYLGGSDATQMAMTGVMLGLAIPYVISELFNGTVDISRHVMTIAHFVQDVYGKMKKFVRECCGWASTPSPDYQRRWLKKRIQQSIATTLRFTPDHVEKLNDLQRRLDGEKEF